MVLNLVQPNFCIGPLGGTYCSVDTNNADVYLRTKNDDASGSQAATSYVFNPTASNPIVQGDNIRGLEYLGPRDCTEYVDGLPFFTFESNNIRHIFKNNYLSSF